MWLVNVSNLWRGLSLARTLHSPAVYRMRNLDAGLQRWFGWFRAMGFWPRLHSVDELPVVAVAASLRFLLLGPKRITFLKEELQQLPVALLTPLGGLGQSLVIFVCFSVANRQHSCCSFMIPHWSRVLWAGHLLLCQMHTAKEVHEYRKHETNKV